MNSKLPGKDNFKAKSYSSKAHPSFYNHSTET